MNMNDTMNRAIMAMIVIILVTGAYYVGRVKGSAQANGGTMIELSEDGTLAEEGTEVTEGDLDGVTETSEVSAAGPTVTAGGEAVAVVDQSAGSIVKVASVTLAQTGWVAVRDNKGWVLGARRFEAGTNTDVEVVLQRNTVAGEKYQVLLYSDDGDKEYDLHKDSLIMNADASVTGATFTAN